MMRRRAITALAAIMLLAGCATNPTARWAQQRQALTATQDTILQLHAAGTLDDEALLVADPAIQAARRALESAEARLPDGPDVDTFLDAAEAALLAAARAREVGR